uniref:Putative secreted protein n=1 Tax=Anopheles marajoara TaxID=58244 RepID=A0A2M4CBP5_9DIPT
MRGTRGTHRPSTACFAILWLISSSGLPERNGCSVAFVQASPTPGVAFPDILSNGYGMLRCGSSISVCMCNLTVLGGAGRQTG